MSLTLNQAAKECSRAKSTLSKAIKSGKLSAEKQDDGSYLIDPAELFRVFPPKKKGDQLLPEGNGVSTANSTVEMAIQVGRLEVELEAERQMRGRIEAEIDDLKSQRDKWQMQAERLLLEKPLAAETAMTAVPEPTNENTKPEAHRSSRTWLGRFLLGDDRAGA